jgi:hypothetical protein
LVIFWILLWVLLLLVNVIFVIDLLFISVILKKLLVMSIFIHCFHHLLRSWTCHQILLAVVGVLTIFVLVIVVLHDLILLIYHFIFQSLRSKTLVSWCREWSDFLLQLWWGHSSVVISKLSFWSFWTKHPFAFLLSAIFTYGPVIATVVCKLTWSILNWSNFCISFDRSTGCAQTMQEIWIFTIPVSIYPDHLL